MKKILLLVPASFLVAVFACNSPSGTSTEKASDSAVLPPAPSNSDATNPSVADTGYSKMDTTRKKDSLRK